MGGGSWRASAFCDYSTSVGRTVSLDGMASCQNMFTQYDLNEELNPYKVIRECCDTEEHPNTIPVILALDVTGSMGSACKRVAQSLNVIMTNLFAKYQDIEFMIMAIGDLLYDDYPIQASQFESDIRIAEHMDKVYFEGGGGGNNYESYSAAWYFGLNNTDLHCLKRGKKGIIITLGDEPLNPYLPKDKLNECIGCNLQQNVDTRQLYEQTLQKFDIYHIAVDDHDTCYRYTKNMIQNTWGQLLGDKLKVCSLDTLPNVIEECINISMSDNTINLSENNSDNIPIISW